MSDENKTILRAYVRGEKVFCPFDVAEFKRVIAESEPSACFNRVLEHALSAATGNRTSSGEELRLARVEWLARDPQSGTTLP